MSEEGVPLIRPFFFWTKSSIQTHNTTNSIKLLFRNFYSKWIYTLIAVRLPHLLTRLAVNRRKLKELSECQRGVGRPLGVSLRNRRSKTRRTAPASGHRSVDSLAFPVRARSSQTLRHRLRSQQFAYKKYFFLTYRLTFLVSMDFISILTLMEVSKHLQYSRVVTSEFGRCSITCPL